MLSLTKDDEFIRSVALNRRVWDRACEDGIKPCQYQPLKTSVYLRWADHGFFSFSRMFLNTWQHHVCLLPGSPKADAAAKESTEWMFEHGALKLVAMPGAHNWNAAQLARRIGYTDEGRISKAMMWRGRLRDVLILGMRP